MEDIYKGEFIEVWKDEEDWVFFHSIINGVTFEMPAEQFDNFCKDIKEMFLEMLEKKNGG